MLIGLAGYARSGKDTVGRFLTEDHGFVRRAFADSLKEVLRLTDPLVRPSVAEYRLSEDLCYGGGWEGAKSNPEVRRLLQALGVAVRDVLGPSTWIDVAMRDLGPRTVITDVRFRNEVEAVRSAGGEVWWILRPGTGPLNQHVSENAIDSTVADRVLLNDSDLPVLAQTISEIVAVLP